MTTSSTPGKGLITIAVIAIAVGAAAWYYWDYVVNPWTRNGPVTRGVIWTTCAMTCPLRVHGLTT